MPVESFCVLIVIDKVISISIIRYRDIDSYRVGKSKT